MVVPPTRDANREALESIRDDPKSLRSDRISAVRELRQLDAAQAEQQTDEEALWTARKEALLTLPPHDRLDWLLGQVREEEEGGVPGDQEDEEEGGWIAPPPAGGEASPRRDDGTPGAVLGTQRHKSAPPE